MYILLMEESLHQSIMLHQQYVNMHMHTKRYVDHDHRAFNEGPILTHSDLSSGDSMVFTMSSTMKPSRQRPGESVLSGFNDRF